MSGIPFGAGSRTTPEYVKFNPSDSGFGLAPVFWKHPAKFTKNADPEGRIDVWGLWPWITVTVDGKSGSGWDVPAGEIFQRKMTTQYTYAGIRGGRPEDQFINFLIEQKKSQLKKLDLGDLVIRDYMLKVYLRDVLSKDGEPRIWRRFKVSGALSLSVLADKILLPLMGWDRSLHAHFFTDFTDGSLFGPKDARSVDMVHIDLSAGGGWVDENKWCLAHLVREVGQTFGFEYDLGDQYRHEILVENILNAEESNGAIQIISGSGAPPMENGNGNRSWLEMLEKYETGTQREKNDVLSEIFNSVNYLDRGWKLVTWSPDWFDIEDARMAVTKALNSPTSIPGKQFVAQLVEGAGSNLGYGLKKRQALVRTVDSDFSGGFFEEVVSTKRDNIRASACAQCGNPNNLRLCTGCKKRYYCSKECQKIHWKEMHKFECEALKKGV